MKKVFLLLFLLGNFNIGFAQNQMQKDAIKSFSLHYNNNDFEQIYQSFSAKMKSVHSKKYYFDFFKNVKKSQGSLLFTELINYSENTQKNSRAIYDGTFEYGNCTIKITMTQQSEVIGFYIIKNKNLM
jgi:hypothetical protein